ncbi:MAG: winged helix DNA-binding protein [Pseudomonadota bacterium]
MEALQVNMQPNNDIFVRLQEASNNLSTLLSQINKPDAGTAASADRGEAAANAPRPDALKLLIRLRARRRNSTLGSFLEWPAWDMLLDLAAVTAEGKHVSVSAICISSGAPQSTALRKLAALEAAGLVRRYLHGTDRRRVCLALTEKGSVLVNDLVAEDLRFFSALGEGQRGNAP